MKLYWKPMWGLDADIRRQQTEGAMFMSNERMEKIIREAYERGKKDGAPDAERVGAVAFGQEVRKAMREFEAPHEYQPSHLQVPSWRLERLLSDWNIPETPASREQQT